MVGGNDVAEHGRWVWARRGDPIEPAGFTNWAEVDLGVGHCMGLRAGRWRRTPCGRRQSAAVLAFRDQDGMSKLAKLCKSTFTYVHLLRRNTADNAEPAQTNNHYIDNIDNNVNYQEASTSENNNDDDYNDDDYNNDDHDDRKATCGHDSQLRDGAAAGAEEETPEEEIVSLATHAHIWPAASCLLVRRRQ